MLLQGLGPNVPSDVSSVLSQPDAKAAFAIWTTTPWTIPANLAVAVNADLDYCLVKAEVRWGGGAWLFDFFGAGEWGLGSPVAPAAAAAEEYLVKEACFTVL